MAKGRKKLQIINYTSNDIDALIAISRCGIVSKDQLQKYAYTTISEKYSGKRLLAMVKEGLIYRENKNIKKKGVTTIYTLSEKGNKVLKSKNFFEPVRKTKSNQLYHDIKFAEIYFKKTTQTIRLNNIYKSENELLKIINETITSINKKLHDMVDFAFKMSDGTWHAFEAIGSGYSKEMINSKIQISNIFDSFYYE